MLALTSLLWGMTFIVIKKGLNDASPFMFLALRFGTAFIVYYLIFRKHFKNISRMTFFRAILISVFFFGGYAFQTLGLRYTTVAKSALFTYMFAPLIPPLQFIFTGKKPKAINVVALAVVFIGVLIYSSPNGELFDIRAFLNYKTDYLNEYFGGSSFNIGDFLSLLGAVSYAFFILLIDRFSEKESPVVMTGFQLFYSALIAIILSVIFEKTFIKPTINLAVSILYLAIPGSVIAVYFMNKYQGMTTAVRASLIYSLEPVFTIIFGWLILREKLSIVEISGAVIIVLGVTTAEVVGAVLEKKRREEPAF